MLCGTGTATVISLVKNIKRVLKKQESESKPDGKGVPANEPSRGSSVQIIDWSKCIFCQTDVKKVAFKQVQTF